MELRFKPKVNPGKDSAVSRRSQWKPTTGGVPGKRPKND